jgi:AraC family transcriptional regulator
MLITSDRGRQVGQSGWSLTQALGPFVVSDVFYSAQARLHAHRHPGFVFALTLRGTIGETCDTLELERPAGSVLFRPAGIAHENNVGKVTSRCLVLEIPKDYVLRPGGRLPLPHQPRVYRDARLTNSFCELAHLAPFSSYAAQIEVEALALLMIARIQRVDSADSVAPAWLVQARRLIDGRPDKRYTLAALARESGVHPAHFSRVFRMHYGLSVTQLIRKRRLFQAAEQLRCYRRAIVDVAFEAGFCSQSHFTTAFKREFGVTPLRYRQASTTAGDASS